MNARLRIVQVVCSAEFAGVERYVTNLSNDLAQAGCDVTVLGGDPLRMAQELSGKQDGWRPSRSVGEAAVRLARLGHVDIVHTHMTEAEVAAAAVRIFTTGRFVSTRHFAARRGSGWAGRLAGVPLRRLVDTQLAVSHYVAAHIDGPSVVVHPGVPRDDSVHHRERTPVVLMAQRLAAEKHIDVALRAWERSELAHAGWELHLAGGGPEEGPLRSLAKDLGVADSCHFLGPRDDLAQRYRRASLFFAPRPDEAFGLAVLEAMAAGLPVVAAAGGGHLETVGVCPDAALFEPGDVDGAAFQLRSLGADEGRRQIYGQKLRAIQREQFDSSAQAAQIVAIYRGLVDPRPTNR